MSETLIGDPMVILDTNLAIDIFNGYEPVKKELQRFSNDELKITIFTKYEMLRGTTDKTELNTRSFLNAFGLCNFTEAAMEETIELYKRQGNKNIDEIDLLILGVSLANDEILITRDGNLGKLSKNVMVLKA